MTKEIKTFAFITMLGALCAGFGVTLATSPDIIGLHAVECEHEGNHYTVKKATTKATGIKEYWVCCKCHEHYLEKPTGKWTDAGTAYITIDANDNRYIPKTNSYDAQGLQYSADGKSITAYSSWTGSKEIVIPEGVTDIGTVFAKTNITSIVIPSTVGTIDGGAFSGCSKLTNVTITEGVESIESKGNWPTMTGAFGDCSSLKQIVIPSSVLEMDAYEFNSANDKLIIYCVATSKPSGWSDYWNYKHQIGSSKFTVYWGNQWHYDANGNPVKN